VGEQFLMLANKLVLGGCNINKYINITNYSWKSSDSENTTNFKAFMR
jgi:hypothetical protein